MKSKNVICALIALCLLLLACTLTVLDAGQAAQPVSPAAGGDSRAELTAEAPSPEGEEVAAGAVFIPTESGGESMQVCNCTTLNVRSSPGLDGIVIAWLKPIMRVRVMEVQGDWARLASGGWVHKGYLCP